MGAAKITSLTQVGRADPIETVSFEQRPWRRYRADPLGRWGRAVQVGTRDLRQEHTRVAGVESGREQ